MGLGLLLGSALGCELFKPSSPEAGDSGATLVANYADPESCLRYMALGIERKDEAGLVAYAGALADSMSDLVGFHAFFDSQDLLRFGSAPPTDWDRAQEAQFCGIFITRFSDPYEMAWLRDEANPYDKEIDVDHKILYRQYKVWAVSIDTSDSLLIAVGYAELHFTRTTASRWALTRWQDRVDPQVGSPPVDPVQLTFGYRRLDPNA